MSTFQITNPKVSYEEASIMGAFVKVLAKMNLCKHTVIADRRYLEFTFIGTGLMYEPGKPT